MQLLEYFGKNKTKNPTLEERNITYCLFSTIQGWIENEFFDPLDIAVDGQMHENVLTSTNEEPEFEYEEPSRMKQARDDVP